MGNDIAKLFGVEREERGLISILLIQSVFLGTFYGFFNISAHSLFLAKFDEMLMARAYILSGLVGIALTWLYTHFQSKMRFHNFSVINLIFVLLTTVSLWFIMSVDGSNWVIFAIFILMGPLNLLALLGFYGTAGRLFTLRQGNRLFGLVDTGIVIGVIVSSFSIPALLSVNVSTSSILLISAVSILAALFVQFIIGKRYEQVRVKAQKEKRASLKIFRDDSYVRSMGLFIAFSVVVAFFIQYSFMAVTRERYPLEEDMASFLGLFEGSMMVFTLLIKTFIFSYLIKNHGLKLTLIVGPVLIGIFVVVAVVIGSIMGFQPESGGFMIFFLLLAVGRLFSKAMKDSLETPAFKVLYQTISEKVRYSVQSAIDGTINEIAALISGLILTGLGALTFVKLIHFSWVLSFLVAIWVYTALRLYREYRKSVRKSIESEEIGTEKDSLGSHMESKTGLSFGIMNNYYDYIGGGELIPLIAANKSICTSIIGYAERNNKGDMLPLLRELSSMTPDKDLAKEIKKLIVVLEKDFNIAELLPGKIGSEIEKTPDKRKFIQAIYAMDKELIVTDLIKLLRDKDPVIRREAIFIVGRQKVIDLLPEVCECLGIQSISKDAYSVLLSFGDDAFDALSAHYFRSIGNTYVRLLIIRLFGASGSKDAITFLFDRLWAVHRDLRHEAVNGLINCNFEPDEESKDKLIQEIQEIIGLLTSNIAAAVTLREEKDITLLKSLEEETLWWYNFLFGLLSLIYDSRSFSIIRSNLESGTVESVNLALEMIDIVADDSIKPRLTALLDVVNEEDKLKTLFQFYPGKVPGYRELVIDLINTDYNRIGVWTKSCAIRSLYKLDDIKDPDFLIALLFSPNLILREEALGYLKNKFEDVFDYCTHRVPKEYISHLTTILKGEFPETKEIYSKINFLSKVFPEFSRNDLLDLGLSMELSSDIKEWYNSGSPFLSWQIESEAAYPYINWAEVESIINDSDLDILENTEMYVLPIDSLSDAVFNKPGISENILMYIQNNSN